MGKITTQKQFETLHVGMTRKLDLIAEYIKKGLTDAAMVEIWALQECLNLELSSIIDLLPIRSV